ncbi:hypothetical protein [Pseudopedobacter beijingensis]|uniref:Uncharacterized protein n=1 Tax=Pseudopedobacter beijingensis TaxID=1207056 RepID=A0ABW4I6B9_9SPHI
MAEQEHSLPYSGKTGNRVGYRRGKKYFERQQTKSYQPPAESLKSANEFGTASKASVLLRNAFKEVLLSSFKTDLHSRLSKRFGEVLRSGPIEKKGTRNVFDGDPEVLRGFEFNKDRSFDGLTLLRLTVNVHDKEVWVQLPSFKREIYTSMPPKAERLWVEVSYAWIDFTNAVHFTSKAPPVVFNGAEDFKGGRFKIAIREEKQWALVVMITICFDYNSSGPLGIIGNKMYQAGRIEKVLYFSDGKLLQYQNNQVKSRKEPEKVAGPDVFWEEL